MLLLAQQVQTRQLNLLLKGFIDSHADLLLQEQQNALDMLHVILGFFFVLHVNAMAMPISYCLRTVNAQALYHLRGAHFALHPAGYGDITLEWFPSVIGFY